jgi:hypothetical protein
MDGQVARLVRVSVRHGPQGSSRPPKGKGPAQAGAPPVLPPTAGMSGCHRLWRGTSCSQAGLEGSTVTTGIGVRGGIAGLSGLHGQFGGAAAGIRRTTCLLAKASMPGSCHRFLSRGRPGETPGSTPTRKRRKPWSADWSRCCRKAFKNLSVGDARSLARLWARSGGLARRGTAVRASPCGSAPRAGAWILPDPAKRSPSSTRPSRNGDLLLEVQPRPLRSALEAQSTEVKASGCTRGSPTGQGPHHRGGIRYSAAQTANAIRRAFFSEARLGMRGRCAGGPAATACGKCARTRPQKGRQELASAYKQPAKRGKHADARSLKEEGNLKEGGET